MKNIRRHISLLLFAALLTSMSACGDTASGSQDTTNADTTTSADTTEAGYDYSGLDFGGEKVKILSTCDFYTMHMQFDREETNGESLNDAIYNRNRLVESNLNIEFENIVVAASSAYDTNNLVASNIQKAVEAGDNYCDIALIPPNPCAALITGGYFKDLLEYDQLQLDEAWYNQSYNESVLINDKMYFGMSDMSVGLTDGMWALFFNENMMTDLKLDAPYDLVREGKWTLDKFGEYLKAAANLNGDDNFTTWNQEGKSVYGMAFTDYNYYRFTNSCEEKIIDNVDGKLAFTAGSEHFFNVAEKIQNVLTHEDGRICISGGNDYDGTQGNYMYVFSVQRSLFLNAEICKAQGFRDFSFEYGLVPVPKYDENQEDYITTIYQEALAFSIPVNCETAERSATVIDALSYEGMKWVVPVYREITVEQKGLRNEDSIEMLGIITDGAYIDLGSVFGLNNKFITAYNAEMKARNGQMASLIATWKQTLNASIETLNEDMAE
ncbi:MAG: hypothetical protein IJ493_08885 [Clostridia bacterium]|nr:hypothetical protein [Clostridia bacterium]